jgi:hypothetical protein
MKCYRFVIGCCQVAVRSSQHKKRRG